MAPSPPAIVRARVPAITSTESSDPSHETSCSSDHGEGRAALLGLHLKRSDDHDGSIVVYHIEERSQTAELPVGCEILAVNGRRIKGGGSACRAAEVLDYFARKYGEVRLTIGWECARIWRAIGVDECERAELEKQKKMNVLQVERAAEQCFACTRQRQRVC